MIYRIIFILNLLIIISCKRADEDNYLFTGTVVDQVTKQPVAGASVYVGRKLFCEINKEVGSISPTALSGSDGKFAITVPKTTLELNMRGGCPKIHASKDGYIGSSEESIPNEGGAEGVYVELFHYGNLSLHVKHDTINDNVDSVEIWISRWPLHNYPVEYRIKCYGNNYDSTFIFEKLWSNTKYNLEIGVAGRSIISLNWPYYTSDITLNPDLITSYSVSFGIDQSLPARVGAVFNSGLTYGSLSDIDGNSYKTITIGTQTWMAENLKTIRYTNGDLIGTTTPANLDIMEEMTPKYQWAYKGDEKSAAIYGRLYTWYAVTDNRNICPSGWHVPDYEEWTTLRDYLANNGYGYGGSGYDIGKSLAALSGWGTSSIPNNVGNDQASNNSSGFSALPGGTRSVDGGFNDLGKYVNWWCSKPYYLNGNPFKVVLGFTSKNLSIFEYYPLFGNSVRCVKDN